MWKIRQEQRTSINELRVEEYVRKLCTFYRSEVPGLVHRYDDEQLLLLISIMVRKAGAWGLRSRDGFVQFVALGLAAGSSFDEDPRVRDFLCLPRYSIEQKVQRLLELVGNKLNKSSGGSSK